jgi:hypothetical protein
VLHPANPILLFCRNSGNAACPSTCPALDALFVNTPPAIASLITVICSYSVVSAPHLAAAHTSRRRQHIAGGSLLTSLLRKVGASLLPWPHRTSTRIVVVWPDGVGQAGSVVALGKSGASGAWSGLTDRRVEQTGWPGYG